MAVQIRREIIMTLEEARSAGGLVNRVGHYLHYDRVAKSFVYTSDVNGIETSRYVSEHFLLSTTAFSRVALRAMKSSTQQIVAPVQDVTIASYGDICIIICRERDSYPIEFIYGNKVLIISGETYRMITTEQLHKEYADVEYQPKRL